MTLWHGFSFKGRGSIVNFAVVDELFAFDIRCKSLGKLCFCGRYKVVHVDLRQLLGATQCYPWMDFDLVDRDAVLGLFLK